MDDQYRIIDSGAGWVDVSSRGRLRVEGADSVSFLQALVTNDVAGLQAGRGLYAAYLTPNGRMIANLEVFHRGDHLLVGVGPTVGPRLAEKLDQLIFSEDARVTDVSSSTYELLVLGVDAVGNVSRALHLAPETLAALPELGQVDWAGGFVARAGDALVPSFRLFGTSEGCEPLLESLRSAEIQPVSVAVAESHRVAAGRGAWGKDLTEEIIPLEAGLLERAISTTKGCYVGQEIVIRMLHRGGGRVAKRLVMLELSPADPTSVAPGSPLRTRDGVEVGKLTSVERAPDRVRVLALGYVRGEHAQIGATLIAGGAATAVIAGFAH